MKPDWKNAPEWANWLVMDADGIWCWFEQEPILDNDQWCYYACTKVAEASSKSSWKHTKEQRCTD